MKKQRFTTLGILLLLFILAACGGQPEAPTAEPTEPAAEPTATEEVMEETAVTNALTVSDQELALSNMVTVPSVTADVDGWMVIHAQADGVPGPVIGFAPVSAGESSDIAVEIDASGATETIYAMLHIDTETIGEYEFPGPDTPAMNAEGNVVVAPFSLTIPNTVSIEDQALDNTNSVTANSVVAAVPGWLVIHAQADGAPGPILGHAPVLAGFNEDVSVVIDPTGATETLYAMLHIDTETIGEYEFPGPDTPAMDAEGNIVTPAFTIDLPASENSVTVADQSLLDNAVTVETVSAAVDGWLVIHAQADGSPGPILGYAPVLAGENSSVIVEIDPAGATDTLYAMLHIDAENIGEYEFPGPDTPAMDTDGNIVTPPFQVDLSGVNAVTVQDQELGTGDTVVVSAIRADVTGWIVIHAQADGKPGPVLGHTAVSAGVNRDVTVEIDAENATDTLYAMLHVDAGTEGEYEFPGPDGPAMDMGGNVVVQPFSTTGASEAVIIEMQDFVFG